MWLAVLSRPEQVSRLYCKGCVSETLKAKSVAEKELLECFGSSFFISVFIDKSK